MLNNRRKHRSYFESNFGGSPPHTPNKKVKQSNQSHDHSEEGGDTIICGTTPSRAKNAINSFKNDGVIGDMFIAYYLIEHANQFDNQDLIELHEEVIEKATQLRDAGLVEKYQARLDTLRPVKQVSNSSTNTTASTAHPVISSPKASRFIGNKKIDDPALIAAYDELFEKHSLKN